MEDGWSLSSETTKEPDKDSLGSQIKALLDGDRRNLNNFPVELQREHQDWEAVFPNLSVVGTKIPVHSNSTNEKQQLRMAVANQLVKLHLWPEVCIFYGYSDKFI